MVNPNVLPKPSILLDYPLASGVIIYPSSSKQVRYNAKVLIVDDNNVCQLLCKGLLNKLGCSVDCAGDGKQALEAVLMNNPKNYNLIFMDCLMPVMDGYVSTRAIRNLEEGTENHIPIIAATDYKGPEEERKCFQSGMDDYLSKPLFISKLATKLEKWVPHLKVRAE